MDIPTWGICRMDVWYNRKRQTTDIEGNENII